MLDEKIIVEMPFRVLRSTAGDLLGVTRNCCAIPHKEIQHNNKRILLLRIINPEITQ